LRYCKSTSFQANHNPKSNYLKKCTVVCDTAKVRVFKQITTSVTFSASETTLFAILQKYEFSSKSQHKLDMAERYQCCLRYCKSTSFQANHNRAAAYQKIYSVVCDTAKVRVFKQITTIVARHMVGGCVVCDTAKVRVFKQITTHSCGISMTNLLFAILQKYEFSSKSQLTMN